MQITSLTEIIRGESHYIIDKLLQKRSSILLSGNIADASLLALQLALDVAAGKPFLGEYQTSLGEVLFIEKDRFRLQRDGQTLNRRPAGTDNLTAAILEAGDERELVRVMKEKSPLLTVIGHFPGSLDYVGFLSRVGSVIALAGNEWQPNLVPIQDVWALQADPKHGYRLAVKPHGISLELSKGENGFVLEGIAEWKPGSGPVWSTAKTTIRNPAVVGGMKSF